MPKQQHSGLETKLSNKSSSNFAIIGFGSQSRAWAKNLKDSGLDFSLFLRPGPKLEELKKNSSFSVLSLEQTDLLKQFNYLILLIPDNQQPTLLKQLAPHLNSQTSIVYAHGYALSSEKLNLSYPQFGHLLLAPKAIAAEVRERFLKQQKLTGIASFEFAKNIDSDKAFIHSLSKAIGITEIIESSFKHECFADLMSEQALLCSTLLEAPKRVYDLMISKGIPKEVAFVECFEEMKLIIDTLLNMGPEAFFNLISPNALCGGAKAMEILFDNKYQEKLENLWNQLEDGSFFAWMKKQDATMTRKKLLQNWQHDQFDKMFK